MNPLRSALVLVVTAWPLAVGGLAAQGVTTAALVGTVTGSDSTALEDAVVTVTNTATGERWQTATRARGSYAFEYLSVGGPYLLEVRAIGFSPGQGPAILLSLGERRRADLSLTAAIVELPEIAVSAAVDPLVNPARTGPAQTIGDSLISRMPIRSRDFSQLVYLSPQAVLDAVGRCVHRRAVGPAQRLPDRRCHQPRSHRIRGGRRLRYAGREQRGAHPLGRGAAGAADPLRAVRRALWHLRRWAGERGDPLGLESLGGIALRLLRGQGADGAGLDRPPGGGLQHQGVRLHPGRTDRA